MMESLQEIWNEPTTRVVVGVLLTAIGVAIAFYVIQKVRGAYGDDGQQLDDWASIREMREEGNIREFEYQHLRKKMASKINDEMTETETESKQPGSDVAETDPSE